MWLSSAVLGNACIIVHWIAVSFKFCHMTLFKYVFPTLKVITNMHFLYVCLYLDYKKNFVLIYFLTCCIVLISFFVFFVCFFFFWLDHV